ncbi:MAG: hypothetical protein HKN23_09220 [Verrucomicrobiales bacterium]|nr:hypothetical protein [Verrucomicrobiales bacterium]
MNRLSTNGPFDLAETLNSGQVFHWDEIDFEGHSGFAGCIGNSPPVFIAQTGPEEIVTTAETNQQGLFAEATLLVREQTGSVRQTNPVASYLGLDLPVERIRATFPENDEFLKEAIHYCPGLRMVRQPVWECLATFITSSLKQVAHIRDISLTLRRRFGNRYEFAGREFFSYPTPEAIAAAGEAELRKCALGYRAKSLFLTARMLKDGEVDLADLARLESNREAHDFLCRFHGVGGKIANCVLLFGCGRVDAFPIDVWIERVLRKAYRKRLKGPKLQAWAEGYFGPFAGYAQQFLFHYARTGKLD